MNRCPEEDSRSATAEDNARLRQLEDRVAALTREMDALKAHISGTADSQSLESQKTKPGLTSDSKLRMRRARRAAHQRKPFRQTLQQHLGDHPDQTVESQIGGIWLGRLGVIMLLTAAVLGARVVIQNDFFQPWQRVVIYYVLSLAGIAYGYLCRSNHNLFPTTILGAGLAGVYFTTYAAFFEPVMRVSDNAFAAIPLLLLCLGGMAWIAHRLRNQNVAGMALFLAYYTMAMTWSQDQPLPSLAYTALAGAFVAVVALIFHVIHRWMLFTWASIVGYYLIYTVFLWRNSHHPQVSDHAYFWISNGTLALNWFLFSLAGIADARKTGEYRRGIAPMAGFNSFMFFSLSWFAIRAHYVESEWMFRAGMAASLMILTVLAETTGPRRNYLYQVFVAKTVIMFTLALQAYLSGEKLVVAIAIESLALAISYRRSGVITFKLLGHLLMLTAFFGSLLTSGSGQVMSVGGISIPSNWFCACGAALIFILTSAFYQHFVRHLKPEQRFLSGQWFLADTLLDLRNSTSSMVYAWAAAVVLLVTGIMDQGHESWLPFLLVVESGAIALLGVMLRTGQVDAASVLLLVAGHVCYYVFLLRAPESPEAFEAQPHFVAYTVGMGLYTFLGAALWERYLVRTRGYKPWDNDLVAAIPHLVATALFLVLVSRHVPYQWGPVLHALLGTVLLTFGVTLGLPSIRLAGLGAFAVAVASFYIRLYSSEAPLGRTTGFSGILCVYLLTFVFAERLWAVLQRKHRGNTLWENSFRAAFVGVPTLLGLMGIANTSIPAMTTWAWGGFAVAAMTIGAMLRETRYRWAALGIFLVAFVRAFAYDLRVLPAYQSLPVFLCMSAVMLLITWLYARRSGRSGDVGQSPGDPPCA